MYNVKQRKQWLEVRSGTKIDVKTNIKCKDISTVMNEYQKSITIQQDESFDGIDPDVPGFHTIRLTAYQCSTVRTMMIIEKKRWLSLTSDYGPVRVYYAAARVSEMVGAGKTIEFLALLSLQRYPAVTPEVRTFNTIDHNHDKYVGRTNVVRVKYTSANIMKPTLVYVGAAVVTQWIDAIKTFTNFRHFAVRNKADVSKLLVMMDDGTINDYDIVVVKNGHAGQDFKWPIAVKVMKKNEIQNPWIFNLLANYTRKTWARVILDDADTIGMPYNATMVPSLFTWIVSSTNNYKAKFRVKNHQYNTAAELLAGYAYGYWRVLHNQTINGILNITSSDTYITKYNGLCSPAFYIAKFTIEHDMLVGLLGAMDDTAVSAVQEMLNNDSFTEAAKAAGIASKSVADIFQSILGDKYAQYKRAEEILAFISTIPEDHQKRKAAKYIPEDDKYTKKRLVALEMPQYNYPGLKEMIKETKEHYTAVYEECGKAVERVKSNIKHGICPICARDLAKTDMEVFILKCCDSVYCASCTIEILGLNRAGQRLTSTCRKCRRKITFTDLIYVGTNIDKTGIADKYALTMADEESVADSDSDAEAAEESDDEKGEYKKAIGIANFCVNRDLRVQITPIDLVVPKLMTGSTDPKSLPPPKYRKVLIYVHMPKACAEVEKQLKRKDVTYWRLTGSVEKLSIIARKFSQYDGDCALVIQNEQHYAGLNLQSASHAVMYGIPHNESILTQFLGRGQRIGRTSQFKVLFAIYNNEYALLEKYIAANT